jgi:hypothetical protein
MEEQAVEASLGFPHEFYSRELVRNFAYAGLRDRIIM